jgi:hypothetical protein
MRKSLIAACCLAATPALGTGLEIDVAGDLDHQHRPLGIGRGGLGLGAGRRLPGQPPRAQDRDPDREQTAGENPFTRHRRPP